MRHFGVSLIRGSGVPAGPIHDNAFGVLRLVFATMVILGHMPVQMDGHIGRDLLSHLFGTVSFGTAAVDCFFLISGYLVTKSYLASPLGKYFVKRVLRIFPAFAVASLLLTIVVAPLTGGRLPAAPEEWLRIFSRILRLQTALAPNAFADTAYPALDPSMWTIGYEFRCYIVVAVAGWAGLYKNRLVYLVIALSLLTLHALHEGNLLDYPLRSIPLIGELHRFVRLFAVFMMGGCFLLFQDRIVLRRRYAVLAFIALFLAICHPGTAELGIATVGAYIVFVAAKRAPMFLHDRGAWPDVSYGLYLYAWPVGYAILAALPGIGLWPAIALNVLFGCAAGWLSWLLVERWFTLARVERIWTMVKAPRPLVEQPA